MEANRQARKGGRPGSMDRGFALLRFRAAWWPAVRAVSACKADLRVASDGRFAPIGRGATPDPYALAAQTF
ncbi:hypothetical protein STUTZSP0542_13610 [Stutzerimonas marianensis]